MSTLKEIKFLKTCPHAEHSLKLGKDAQGQAICTVCNNKLVKQFDFKKAVIIFLLTAFSIVMFFLILYLITKQQTPIPRIPMILAISAVSAYFGGIRFIKST
jgi:uncharacterized membrane protein YbhN (UPF0104 family)